MSKISSIPQDKNVFYPNLLALGTYYRKTMIPDVGYFSDSLLGNNHEKWFYHICTEDKIKGRIIRTKKGMGYCKNCEKDLKIPYKSIVFAIKLADFRK